MPAPREIWFLTLSVLLSCSDSSSGLGSDVTPRTESGGTGAGDQTTTLRATGGAFIASGGQSTSGGQSASGASAALQSGGNPGIGGGVQANGSTGGSSEGAGPSTSGGALGAGGGIADGGGGSGGAEPNPPGSALSIDGRRLFLGGQPFYLRGVNWNPVPKGQNHPEGLDYSGFADQDITLMKAAGINAIRTYERLEDEEVLDKLYSAGIYVFSTVYGWHEDSPSVVIERINAVKDHPAIMAWVIGNEWNYNQLYKNDGDIDSARDKLNEAAALIKDSDPSHPVSTIWGGTGGLADIVSSMPTIDIWGINFYGGLSLGDVLSAWPQAGETPMYLGEYGADAYNSNTNQLDEASQAEATRVLTQEIINGYVTESGGVGSGGFLFEWSDEWWKDTGGSIDEQDVGGIAPGGGPHPDQVFNEEFWGIVDIDRNPRPAYFELQQLYTN